MESEQANLLISYHCGPHQSQHAISRGVIYLGDVIILGSITTISCVLKYGVGYMVDQEGPGMSL